ncbi:MAG: hypothetical protein LCH39_15695, partial [Proteobacteria bacterium]|nr:hypothetical protein [Pseudomonadota bacterium]
MSSEGLQRFRAALVPFVEGVQHLLGLLGAALRALGRLFLGIFQWGPVQRLLEPLFRLEQRVAVLLNRVLPKRLYTR